MESKNYLPNGVKEMTEKELIIVNGGGLGYDIGFFLRECVVYGLHGGGTTGLVAAATDLGLYYRPLN